VLRHHAAPKNLSNLAALVLILAAVVAIAPNAHAAQAYRYYKFTRIALRGPTPNSIQLGRITSLLPRQPDRGRNRNQPRWQ